MKDFFRAFFNLFPKKEDPLDELLREKGIDPNDAGLTLRRAREQKMKAREEALQSDEE